MSNVWHFVVVTPETAAARQILFHALDQHPTRAAARRLFRALAHLDLKPTAPSALVDARADLAQMTAMHRTRRAAK